MKRKDRDAARTAMPYPSATYRIADQINKAIGCETRVVVPGHIQRGGAPSAFDRVLSTRFGVHAATLIRDGVYGRAVGLSGDKVVDNALAEVASKSKLVPPDHQMVTVARDMGISLGD